MLLETLVEMSNRFSVSLDYLLKEDFKMIRTIDKERILGTVKQEKSLVDFLTGAGTGLIVSCLFSPDSAMRTAVILVGALMVGIGWYKKTQSDKRILNYISKHEASSDSLGERSDT